MLEKLGRSRSQPKAPVYRTPQVLINTITYKEGFGKAYSLDNKFYVNGDTLYVAGTSYLQDVWGDLKIPFYQTAKAQRYNDAETLLNQNQQIKNIVGHSLGGSVTLELQRNHQEKTFKTSTYGAPVESITAADNKDKHRYRNLGDPVCVSDKGATMAFKGSAFYKNFTEGPFAGLLDAHAYDNFSNTRISHEQSYHQTDFVDLLK
jgi:pimeloyl-ACP methyl ester carboxylesterase